MEEKAMQDAKASKMVGNTPKKTTIQGILHMGGKIMAAGKQYYKYKKKAELFDGLLYDIQTLLIRTDIEQESRMATLAHVYMKYERLSKDEKEAA